MFAKLFAVVLALASVAPAAPCNGAARVIQNCEQSGTVALTFDDGPVGYDLQIANSLNGGKGTFFINGNNWDCIYNKADDLKQLYASGHTIGSHTWSHADLARLNYNQINDELAKVEDAMIKILGVRPTYFRPPFGSYNDLVIQVLKDRGYTKLFMWTDDTEDGNRNGEDVPYAKSVYDRIAGDFPKPHLVLNHSPYASTANQVVPHAVQRLQGAGYKLQTVDQCLGSAGEWPYIYVRGAGNRDSSWVC
jgi:peptidoglycan/xylan/chitin deacetylase (PgdA/CDA1 family)